MKREHYLIIALLMSFTVCLLPLLPELLGAQTKISLTQVRLPSVVLIRRSVCVEPAAVTTSDCTNLELYTLSFSDGSQRLMVAIPDDGLISKSIKWVPVPIVPPGT